jgi:ferredoxin-NADP reductase
VPLTTLLVRDVIRSTPRTRLLRIDTGPDGFAFAAGQAVMAGLHGSPLRKPYSIASAPAEAARNQCLDLLVLVDDSGGPDPHLELAAPGTALDIEGPFGRFALPPTGDAAGLLLVAGGTGIAPLRSMLVEALEQPVRPRISLVYSARSLDDLAYRDELEAMAAEGLITLRLTVTRDDRPASQGRRGRIDRAMLASALSSATAWCLVCGPPALVSDVRSSLSALGVDAARIGVERYDV